MKSWPTFAAARYSVDRPIVALLADMRRILVVAALLCAAWGAGAARAEAVAAAYELGPGDEMRIIVFGEENLSGEYSVSSTGMVAFPLIGTVRASGRSPRSLESAIESKLLEGYLKDPRVSIEVVDYRPFFIEGEVKEAGQYPYSPGMTVREAVSIAGGYTYRAETDEANIVRDGARSSEMREVPVGAAVLPGDYVEIEERFF